MYECSLGSLDHSGGHAAQNPLHHGQMLLVVVRLEERHSRVQLEENAADRPDIARLRPAELCKYSGSVSGQVCYCLYSTFFAFQKCVFCVKVEDLAPRLIRRIKSKINEITVFT